MKIPAQKALLSFGFRIKHIKFSAIGCSAVFGITVALKNIISKGSQAMQRKNEGIGCR